MLTDKNLPNIIKVSSIIKNTHNLSIIYGLSLPKFNKYLAAVTILSLFINCNYCFSDEYSLKEQHEPYSAWFQPYFNNSKQHDIGSEPGYKAYTSGFMIGIEKIVNPKRKIGVGAGYAYAKQQSLVTNLTYANINNYFAMFYGTQKYQYAIDWDWSLSFGQNYYSGSRAIPNLDEVVIATSNYTGFQSTAQTIVSKRYHHELFDIIPQINANLSYAILPAYSELGAGDLGNNVAQSRSAMVTVGTGVQTEWFYTKNNSIITPALRALVYYNLNNAMFNSLVGYAAGTSLLSTPIQSKTTWQLGGSLEWKTYEKIAVRLQYDLQLKHGYYNNLFFLNFKYLF